MITFEQVRKRFHYDPETGIMTRLPREDYSKSWNTRFANKPLTHRSGHGYIYVQVKMEGIPKQFLVHRLIFLWMTGVMPEVVDHINGIIDDNRWINLRAATKAENSRNRKARVSSSGFKNIHKQPKGWQVRISYNNKLYTKFFTEDKLEEAVEYARTLHEELQGEFARHE